MDPATNANLRLLRLKLAIGAAFVIIALAGVSISAATQSDHTNGPSHTKASASPCTSSQRELKLVNNGPDNKVWLGGGGGSIQPSCTVVSAGNVSPASLPPQM